MKSTAIYFALLAGAVTAKPVNLPTHSAPSTADYRFRCGGDFDCPLNQRCGYEVTFNGELLSSECIPAVDDFNKRRSSTPAISKRFFGCQYHYDCPRENLCVSDILTNSDEDEEASAYCYSFPTVLSRRAAPLHVTHHVSSCNRDSECPNGQICMMEREVENEIVNFCGDRNLLGRVVSPLVARVEDKPRS